MFNNTIILFDQYYRCLDANAGAEFNRDLGSEVRKRLLQLEYIIDHVHRLEGVYENTMTRYNAIFQAHIENLRERGVPVGAEALPAGAVISSEECRIGEEAMFEMELLTESFYYFAGRIRTILKNPRSPVPGLSSFECEGVRNTRNKLLEHAEGKDSGISILSFGWGGPQGPVIKALRYSGQEKIFPDRGLYENADELRFNLETLLQRLLFANLPAP